jgi:hypothetical protein
VTAHFLGEGNLREGVPLDRGASAPPAISVTSLAVGGLESPRSKGAILFVVERTSETNHFEQRRLAIGLGHMPDGLICRSETCDVRTLQARKLE